MTQLNRRDVFRVAAAGAATAATVRAATSGSPSYPTSARSLRREFAAAALRGGLPGSLPGSLQGLSPVHSVTVQGCRSWSRDVLLTLPGGASGLVALDATGLALAAAAQLGTAPLFARVWGHDADAEHGLGRFAGVLLAVDSADLADLDPNLEA